jgi:triacylglycerol lipase
MLARLQQFMTLGTLAAALLWAWLYWRAEQPGWAVAGAAVIVGGYALVLALEFVLLRLAHGSDPTERASLAQLLRAWWGEVRAAPRVFCWRQPFFSQRWPDHLPVGARGQRGVLLVHGFVCNRGLWNPWLQRLTDSGIPVVAVNMEPPFGSIDDGLAAIEDGVRRLEVCTGTAPVIVGHSMGGLALRRWWAEQGDVARVHHAITLGTPHQGTWLARFAMSRNGREMCLGSAWLATLTQREAADGSARFTCFYSHCDNIVFPPAVGMLPGADNRHLPGVAHVHMVEHDAPWQELQRWLQPAQP